MEELKDYFSILHELVEMYKDEKIDTDGYADMLNYLLDREEHLLANKGFIKVDGKSVILKFVDDDKDSVGYCIVNNPRYVEPAYTIQEILQIAKDKDTSVNFYKVTSDGIKHKYTTDGYVIFSHHKQEYINRLTYDKYKIAKIKFILD